MKVLGYARVSTDDQARDGVSIDAQVERVTAYCIAKDWDLVNVVIDGGVSAKTLNRSGLQNIIAEVKDENIDAVIVYKLDRLTRSVVDLNKLIELFDKYNVALVSLVESLDATSATGRLMLNLLASVSQWEREVIGERTKDAMAFLKAKKKVYSRPVFGFTTQNNKLVELADEQDIVRIMQQWRDEGLSYRDIVTRLNAAGVSTKRGGRWQANTVRQIVSRQQSTSRNAII